MTHAVKLKLPLRSALKQTCLIAAPAETQCGSQTVHLSLVVFLLADKEVTRGDIQLQHLRNKDKWQWQLKI